VTDQQVHERVRSVVEGPLSDHGFELVDVERQGGILRITVDLLVGPGDQVDLLVGPGDQVDLLVGPGDQVDLLVGPGDQADRPGGIDLDGITEATRLVNDLLDRNDLVGDTTGLEVSSPGIERPLRTPAHFRRFVGTEVAVKAKPGVEGDRRLAGILEAADDEGVVVAGRRLAYADIERARTVFVWPAQPKKKMGRAS
jgi:ribosome maturation factor RimP